MSFVYFICLLFVLTFITAFVGANAKTNNTKINAISFLCFLLFVDVLFCLILTIKVV